MTSVSRMQVRPAQAYQQRLDENIPDPDKGRRPNLQPDGIHSFDHDATNILHSFFSSVGRRSERPRCMWADGHSLTEPLKRPRIRLFWARNPKITGIRMAMVATADIFPQKRPCWVMYRFM